MFLIQVLSTGSSLTVLTSTAAPATDGAPPLDPSLGVLGLALLLLAVMMFAFLGVCVAVGAALSVALWAILASLSLATSLWSRSRQAAGRTVRDGSAGAGPEVEQPAGTASSMSGTQSPRAA